MAVFGVWIKNRNTPHQPKKRISTGNCGKYAASSLKTMNHTALQLEKMAMYGTLIAHAAVSSFYHWRGSWVPTGAYVEIQIATGLVFSHSSIRGVKNSSRLRLTIR